MRQRKEIKEKIKQEFRKNFEDDTGIIISLAPGRVNLIGEHTDYNDGFVLPITIDRAVSIGMRKRDDPSCRFYSIDFDEISYWDIDNIERTPAHHWSNYIKGVMKFLKEEGYNLKGVEGVVSGDVPIGAGLSSSAAIEMATAYGLQDIFQLEIDPLKMILLCQKAENKFVGVNCGIMDQFVSRLGRKDHALFIDCRTLDYEQIPFKLDDTSLLIVDTKVKRELAKSAYNQRRAECDEGVKFFQRINPDVKALRDVDFDMFEKYGADLPDIIRKRVSHVVSENQRVVKAIDYLKQERIDEFGELLYGSHKSLRQDYEVSCQELDLIVDTAKSAGALGARLTGAGFGGSALILVQKESIDDISKEISKEYQRRFGYSPSIMPLEKNLEASILRG
jgi:galactokinase